MLFTSWMMNERRLATKLSCRYWKSNLTKLLSCTEINDLKKCVQHLVLCKLVCTLFNILLVNWQLDLI